MTIELELDEETLEKLHVMCQWYECSHDELISALIRYDLSRGELSVIHGYLKKYSQEDGV